MTVWSPPSRGRSRWWLAVLATAASAGVAHADDADGGMEPRLAGYESAVRQLTEDLPRPNLTSSASSQRRLLDAEIAYSLGDYDAAAIALFELASKPGADRETATFYLAEALFQKGDRGAARGYYEQVVANGSVASRYYQPALERLVEIAIVQKDDTNLGEHLTALDRISPGLRLPSVPYVRGKLAYSQGKYDDALAYFQDVPKGSDDDMQAAYYMGTTYVAKQDVGRATEIFTELIGRRPKTANDRRILELSQLALGRLYYERDQQSKSIDAYLMVDRHSDLFPDALYEVAWVYVKAKQYDKALRALELLARSDPGSNKTPTVRLLEGNLRIRKAQMLRGAQILGTIDASGKDQVDPAAEYDRAVQVFTETHDAYLPSYAALVQMASGDVRPAQYLNQIAGRSEHVFQAAAPIPEAAVRYLRDEPEVQRVVSVEGDLGEIKSNITEAETAIGRLEGVLAAGDRGAVYPALASRRRRAAEIDAALIRMRNDLAEQELKLGASPSDAGLTATRRQQFAAFAALPDPDRAMTEHLAQARAGYDALEQTASEAEAAIGATEATAVALRKYSADTPDLPADLKRTVALSLDEAAREADAIENEIDAVHRELQIGRDLAVVAAPGVTAAAAARAEVRAAEDAEHKSIASAGRSGAAGRLVALGDRAAQLAAQLAEAQRAIDAAVDQGLQEIRTLLAQEKAQLAAYKAELAEREAEVHAIGGVVLAASFKDVKVKFYDIVIRSDVGRVDVSWSQKEDIDDDLKRLNLSRQRELKQLKDEFKDILDAGTPRPSAPPRKSEVAPAGAPSGSPDKKPAGERVNPGSASPSAPAAPTVKPGDKAPPAKKPATPGSAR